MYGYRIKSSFYILKCSMYGSNKIRILDSIVAMDTFRTEATAIASCSHPKFMGGIYMKTPPHPLNIYIHKTGNKFPSLFWAGLKKSSRDTGASRHNGAPLNAPKRGSAVMI